MLGLEVDRAVALLEADGVETYLIEVSSRKGVQGDQRRVVRALQCEENKAELTWARFKTDVGFVPEEDDKID